MGLIQVVVVLIVVGLLLWLAITYIPMAPPFPRIITAVVIICVVLWLLNVFGILNMGDVHVGHIGRG